MEEFSNDTKIDLLKHFQSRMRDETKVLRERQDKIFTWSNNILLLVIGALLIVDRSKSVVWSTQGSLGKAIASLAILVLVWFSLRWQQRLRNWQEESVEVENKIEKLLHCYDKGFYGTEDGVALYPERWAQPREYHRRISFRKRILRVNYVSATALLGILAVAMIWFSGY